MVTSDEISPICNLFVATQSVFTKEARRPYFVWFLVVIGCMVATVVVVVVLLTPVRGCPKYLPKRAMTWSSTFKNVRPLWFSQFQRNQEAKDKSR